MNIDNQLIVIKTSKNKYLSVVENDKEFITNEGKFKFSDLKKIPSIVTTTTGIDFQIYTPTYKEFVLLMKRGPQIIYPKDVGQIIVESNLHNSSRVLEIGSGSGALTLYLYSLLQNSGKLYSLDSSKINQRRANKTISRYLSTYSKDTVDVNFINEKLDKFNFKNLEDKIDAIITDVPEPWDFFINNKIDTNLNWVSYLPSMSQIIRINETLEENAEQVNKDPYGAGWLVKIRIEDESEIDQLFNCDEYVEFLEGV